MKGVLGAMRWLIKSGLFTTIVNIGVEFLVIILTELMIPLIFAAVDLLVCVLDLFKPSGWQVQFDCVEEGGCLFAAATSDLLVFTSIPLALNVFVNILEATMNSNTAKRFFQPNKKLHARRGALAATRTANSNNEVREHGPADLPQAREPGLASSSFADDGSPASMLDDLEHGLCGVLYVQGMLLWNSDAAFADTRCQALQVPEARAIWMLVVAITTLVSEGKSRPSVRPPASAHNRPNCDSDQRHLRYPHRKHQPEPPSGCRVGQPNPAARA